MSAELDPLTIPARTRRRLAEALLPRGLNLKELARIAGLEPEQLVALVCGQLVDDLLRHRIEVAAGAAIWRTRAGFRQWQTAARVLLLDPLLTPIARVHERAAAIGLIRPKDRPTAEQLIGIIAGLGFAEFDQFNLRAWELESQAAIS